MDRLLDVLHEDDALLVVNKPSGLVCHPTKNGEWSSLIGRVRLHLYGKESPRLVNRLDRETSGVIVVAKSIEAARELGRLWESRAVEKDYLAIVHGHLSEDSGRIEAPLGPDDVSRVAIKDCVRPDGARAVTDFVVERRFRRSEGRFSVVRLHPRTGRKHQLRIHLAHVGHAVVGDKLYGGDEDLYLALVEDRLTPEQRGRLILPHHALHAAATRFDWRGKNHEFEAHPEAWFIQFLPCPE